MAYLKTFDNARIFYKKHKGKNKQTIIFLHGWVVNHTFWHNQIELLKEEGYSLISVDIRGHGRSEKGKDQNLESYVKDLLFIIRKEKIKKAFIMGHSYGALVALKLAEEFPKKVDGIVLLTPIFPEYYDFWTKFKLWLLDGVLCLAIKIAGSGEHKDKEFNLKKKGFNRWIRFVQFIKNPRDVQRNTLQSIRFENVSKSIEKIKAPILIITGSRDPFAPLDKVTSFIKSKRNISLLALAGKDHLFIFKHMPKINETILRWIRER